jgi:hypothetical protein
MWTSRDENFALDAGSGDTVVVEGMLTLDLVCYQCHTDPATGAGGSASQQSLVRLALKARGIHR